MSMIQAILLGILQGLTEFLPVSSSGHLAIFKYIFHMNTENGLLFDVLLHVGTLIAICIAFYQDILQLILEGLKLIGDLFRNIGIFYARLAGKKEKTYINMAETPYRRFVILILIATVPTGIIGILGKDFVAWAETGLLVPGICLILTSVLMFLTDRIKPGNKGPEDGPYLNAFEVGICQGFATLPGLSRSGTTIFACYLCGFQKEFAVKFSFIMSIPAVLGAALLELKDLTAAETNLSQAPCWIAGMAVAAVVGFFCIKTMLVLVRKQKFFIFGVYCLIVGCLCLAGYLFA